MFKKIEHACVQCGKGLPTSRISMSICSDECLHEAMIYSERMDRIDNLNKLFAQDMDVGEIAEHLDSNNIANELGIPRFNIA